MTRAPVTDPSQIIGLGNLGPMKPRTGSMRPSRRGPTKPADTIGIGGTMEPQTGSLGSITAPRNPGPMAPNPAQQSTYLTNLPPAHVPSLGWSNEGTTVPVGSPIKTTENYGQYGINWGNVVTSPEEQQRILRLAEEAVAKNELP